MPPKKSLATQDTKSNKKQKIDDSDVGSGTNDGRPLTREEEEEMSSALIAQLLAQEGGGGDHGYYAEYNNDYQRYGDFDMSDEDEDYWDGNYRPKSKSRAKKAKSRPKKKATKPSAPKATIATAEPVSTTPTSTTTTTTTTVTDVPPASTGEPTKDDKAITTEVQEPNAITPAKETAQKAPEATPTPAPALASEPTPTPAPKPATKEKKPQKETAPGINTGTYSEEEERRFVEALELFGRDWPKVEEHVRTRDANSIRSHAQKHFIKLFRDNIPLPPKILETGPGYTLSGRDLDPYSAAARPYLSQRLLDDPSLLPAQSGTRFSPPDPSNPQPKKSKEKPPKAESSPSQPKDKEKEKEHKSPKESSPKESKPARTRPVRESSRSMDVDFSSRSSPYGSAGRTDYSKARLRSARERTSINYNQMASDLDPLTMVKCEPFCGKPNSGVAGCQPFKITVQSNVLLGMDFHAHLMTTEIIGFLAGTWDPKTKTIHIQANFPCRSLPTGQNHVNVEMDPTSEFEVRQEIEKRNMRIVGWYHSHPTFTPDPSLVDIENQTSYQRLFKDEAMNEEPFVGAIIGPYDPRLPGLSSVINWFYISQWSQERGHPKRLIYDLIEDTCLPEEEASHWLKLIDEYRNSPERVNFNEQWRQGESETNLQKLLVSLGRRMPWLRDQLKREQEERQKEGEQEPLNKQAEGDNNNNISNDSKADDQLSSEQTVQPTETSVPDVPESGAKAVEKPEEDVEMSEASEVKVEAAVQPQATVEAVQDSELAEATSAIAIDSAAHGDNQPAETVATPVSESVEMQDAPPLENGGGAAEPAPEQEATEAISMEDTTSTSTLSTAMASSTSPSVSTPFEGGVAMSRSASNVSRESLISIGSESSGRQLVSSLKLSGILQDEFLLRVEQELSTWEPVLG
ncbi:hypothetical protein BGW42_007394 [Actinomortierella wolfii]|nr:hypothetical protein BGW42_007394 [Actinomortierella wolfii]